MGEWIVREDFGVPVSMDAAEFAKKYEPWRAAGGVIGHGPDLVAMGDTPDHIIPLDQAPEWLRDQDRNV